jgi:predicted enzyme related to lactoylglutathione lyase
MIDPVRFRSVSDAQQLLAVGRSGTPKSAPPEFAVDDIDAAIAGVRAHGGELAREVESYKDIYRLCYLRGPEGIIVELAERID